MRKFIALTAAGIAALSIAACGGSRHQYPANVQTNSLNACETHGTTEKCGCALQYVEDRMSLDKFQVAEQGVEAGGDTPQWIYDAVKSCS